MKNFLTKQLKKVKNKEGFTLVEMIVVLAIIGILIAMLAPNVAKLVENAQKTSDSAKASQVMNMANTVATEAITAGYSLDTTAVANTVIHMNGTGTGTPLEAYGVVISTATEGSDDAFRKFIFSGAGPAVDVPNDLIGGADSMLPASTLRGTDRIMLYISTTGVVMGSVLYEDATVDTISAVAGVAPDKALATTGTPAVPVVFDTTTLRGGTIDVATGKVAPKA